MSLNILKCGTSLPSVDSIQFNNEEENDELGCHTRSSEQLRSSSQTPIMGNKCTKRATFRRAYTSSDDEDELTESKEEEKVSLMRRAPNECFASVANHGNGDLDDERLVRSARAVTSPLERMKVSAHSTPTSSPQRQKPKFWHNFTQQFKTSSRDSLQKMHPKRTIFRKFSAGPEFAPKKKTLGETSHSNLVQNDSSSHRKVHRNRSFASKVMTPNNAF
ncbi:hypothetical protein M3Y97_00975900 [Aphelenchoides bicaudatus]|nr:hypothetical protein M3Y97_00975900 [Aphelenchoides bicaudatus]